MFRQFLRRVYVALPFKKPLYIALRACVRLPASVYQHLHFVDQISISIEKNKRFKMHHFGALVENDLFWAGYGNGWESTSLRLWARLAAVSNTIFDIGANTGVYALAAKTIGRNAKVFAFEPVMPIANRLRSNIALNRFEIVVEQVGISNETGKRSIYIPSKAHSYSASLNPTMLSGSEKLIETIIPTLRIDDFIEQQCLTSADLFKDHLINPWRLQTS